MNKITLGIIGVVIVGASFYAGTSYGQSKSAVSVSSGARNFSMQGRQAGVGDGSGARGGMRGGGGAMGDIIAKDATSITLKLRDGGSRIVFFATTTPILKSTPGNADDLKIGESISVMGVQNPDGSVSAQSVQIRRSGPDGGAR